LANSSFHACSRQLQFKWDIMPLAKSCLVEASSDANNAAAWKNVGSSTKVRLTVKGLTSGVRHTSRVAAIPAGQGPRSNEVPQVSG
jgi:hypothetical protein